MKILKWVGIVLGALVLHVRHDLDAAVEVASACRLRVELTRTEDNEWVVRVVGLGRRQYDINNDRMPCRIDVLYGYSVIRAAAGVRVWGA